MSENVNLRHIKHRGIPILSLFNGVIVSFVNGDPTGNRTRASIPQGGHAKTPAKAI